MNRIETHVVVGTSLLLCVLGLVLIGIFKPAESPEYTFGAEPAGYIIDPNRPYEVVEEVAKTRHQFISDVNELCTALATMAYPIKAEKGKIISLEITYLAPPLETIKKSRYELVNELPKEYFGVSESAVFSEPVISEIRPISEPNIVPETVENTINSLDTPQ